MAFVRFTQPDDESNRAEKFDGRQLLDIKRQTNRSRQCFRPTLA
jgi:hypothetical protein